MPPLQMYSSPDVRHIGLTVLRTTALASAVVLISACGGGSDAVTSPPVTPVVTSVTVVAPAGTLQVGQAYQFTATAKDNTGAAISGAPITWSVTPSSAAGVTATGIVTPVAPGAATVRAATGTVAGTAAISFVDAPPPLQADVLMSGEIFLPFNTTVKLNGVVRFNFPPGIVHNVIFANRAGVPGDILQTQNVIVSRAFSTVGTFPFDCTIHPGMSGQITVVP
ncbi:MAG: Ig-like domain-containing protein [Gemmatimonadota bacterium]|nr:Ig-like domain-containing protein [Gemmatimonadota bacterium]